MILSDLLRVEDGKRDLDWENQFLQEFTASEVYLMDEEPQLGPDGWPYLMVTSEISEGEPNENIKPESVQKILHWLSSRGIGLVLNPEKNYPDFVFSFGMIWYFRRTGRFYSPNSSDYSNQFSIQSAKQTQFGQPNEDFLPQEVRNILKQYFAEYGVLSPRICMVQSQNENINVTDLLFSAESVGNPEEANYKTALEAISWFLPPHYSLVMAREVDLPIGVFKNL